MTNIVNNININRSSLHDVFEALCTSFILESIKLDEKIFSIRFESNEIYNRLRTENNCSTSYNYYKEQKSLAQVYMDGLEHTNNISKNKRIGF